jgi:potassium efflux system protein
MMSTLLKRLRGAFVIACGALVLITAAGPLATPALAQAAHVPAQGQPEQPDQPRRPHAGDPTTTPAPPPPLSPETKALRAKLDASKLDLDQREAALNRRDLSDAELQGLRQGIDPVTESLRALIGDLAPKLEAAKARLEQLGPKPKEDDPEESADVARDRAERDSAVAELDETQRLARAVLIQAEQLTTQVSDRRRTLFTRALFERTYSILSPDLWAAAARNFPRDLSALGIAAQDTIDRSVREARLGVLLLLGLALGAAVGLTVGRRYLAPRFVTRDPAIHEPPRRRHLLAAVGVLLLGAVPPAAGTLLIAGALDATNILPPRIQPVALILLGSFAFVAFVNALAQAILAPGGASWRLVPLGDKGAARVARFAVVIAAIVAAGKTLEALNQAIVAALPLTVLARGVFALAAALVLAELLRRFAITTSDEEASLGPYIPTETEAGSGLVRIVGWAAVVIVIGSVLVGYVAFASFLVDQLVWISVLLALLLLAIALADEFIGSTLRDQTRIATALQANTGLRRRSLAQIGVLATGFARVILILIAGMLALAPWGIESADLLSSLRAAFVGFKVGDVTISLSAIAIAALIFALGFTVTRVVQRWLNTTYLPATDLDAGLRNSILTAASYLGIIVSGAVAFSYLGLSLDRLAIVAGALSVGIGFGLQSIVNNFVSGLILLWERPIRVGDLVVVGDGEGHVRRINVRATEIETFDRSTVIVPNSSLISGVVKNRVRSDRTGRVIAPVSVPRTADPVRAAEIIAECARAHTEVLKEPPPRVLFKKIGDAWFEFDLVCFVADVNFQARVQSELNFALFQRLTAEHIIAPPGTPTLDVHLGSVGAALEHIVQAIGKSNGADKPGRTLSSVASAASARSQ